MPNPAQSRRCGNDYVTATEYLGTTGSLVLLRGIDQDTDEPVTVAGDVRGSWAIIEMLERGESVTVSVGSWQIVDRGSAPGKPAELARDYWRHRHMSEWADYGQALVEYVLILALIAMVAIVALTFLGARITMALSDIGTSIWPGGG